MIAVISLPALAHATSAWLPAQALTENGSSAYGPAIASDSSGTVLEAWSRSDGTHYRVYTAIRAPGGTFTPAAPISAPGVTGDEPAVAFDALGNAIVVWRSNGILVGATRPPGGSFGAPEEVSPTNESANVPQVIFDSQGEAIVIWVGVSGTSPSFTYRVESNLRPSGGNFGVPHELDSAQSPDIMHMVNFFPAPLAADGQGDVYAAWTFSSEETGGIEPTSSTAIRYALRPAGGSFSAHATLASATFGMFAHERVGSSEVAADPQGDALMLWERSTTEAQTIEAKFRPAGGEIATSAEKVSGSAEGAYSPRVAMDAKGSAIAVWGSSGNKGIRAASRPLGGGFGAPQLISEPGVLSLYPDVTVAANGDVIAAWQRYSPEPSEMQSSTRPAGGSFGAVVPISPTTKSGAIGSLGLAVDGQGDAAASWTRIDKDYRLEVAGYDGAAPQLQGLAIPSQGAVGSSLAFSSAPLDVWSTVSTAWTFGDGGSASGASVSHAYGAPGTYPVTVTATDALGNAASASGDVVVGAAATTASTSGKLAPEITSATQSNPVWREGRGLATISRSKRPLGTTFSVGLDQQARLNFAFTRRLAGRKVKGRCVTQTHKNRHGRACKRTVTQGTLSFAAHSGTNKVRFQGRTSSSKRLPPGRYVLTITATGPGGQRSQPKSLSFTIVR